MKKLISHAQEKLLFHLALIFFCLWHWHQRSCYSSEMSGHDIVQNTALAGQSCICSKSWHTSGGPANGCKHTPISRPNFKLNLINFWKLTKLQHFKLLKQDFKKKATIEKSCNRHFWNQWCMRISEICIRSMSIFKTQKVKKCHSEVPMSPSTLLLITSHCAFFTWKLFG